MCTSPRRVGQAARDLMISPTRFFIREFQGEHSKATLAWVLGLGLLVSLALDAASQVLKLQGDPQIHPPPLGETITTVLSVMPASLGQALLMTFPPLLVVFGFLWLTSRVVKAPLTGLQTLILCLFFTLPALVGMNLIQPLVLLGVPGETARMAVMAAIILLAILWSLTVMVLGVQAYTHTSWVRALGVVSPVAVFMFTMGGWHVVTLLQEILLRQMLIFPPAA